MCNNPVGFQTNLKFGEQQRVFRMIPGLEFRARVRALRRDAPQHVLNKPGAAWEPDLSLKAKCPNECFCRADREL